MRVVSALVIIALICASIVAHRNGAPGADACSVVPSTLEDHVKKAAFIGIVEPVSVGDGTIRAPKLTATPTVASSATSSPLPDSETPVPSATRRSFITISTPTANPTATTEPPRRSATTELHGRTATVRVIDTMFGNQDREFAVDVSARQSLEQSIRLAEAGYVSTCGIGSLPVYHVGHRYVLIATAHPNGGLGTVARFVVSGNYVLIEDPEHDSGWNSLSMSAQTYGRFLSDVPVDISDVGEKTTFAHPQLSRLSLSRMNALLLGMRDPRIAPPETGSAGLAASR